MLFLEFPFSSHYRHYLSVTCPGVIDITKAVTITISMFKAAVDENLMSSALIDFCTLMLLKAHSLKCHSDHDAINLGDDDDDRGDDDAEDHRQP